MKKFLFLSLIALCASYVYYVYASSPTALAKSGCIGKEVWECQVWYVNAEGGIGMILEEGRNVGIIIPEPND